MEEIKKYVVSATCTALLAIALVAVAFAQPWAPEPTHKVPLRYLGLHEPDAPGSYADINQFAQAIGRQPNLVSYYSPWAEPFQRRFAITAMEHGATTLVQMDPINVSLDNIASGRYDSYLHSFAAAIKAFGTPVIISFGHEMNGNWYSWGHRHTSPTTFVAAWRHIVKTFRAAGSRNAIWMWTVNVINNDLPVPIPDPAPWWPGSSYVNWVGIDGYYYNSSSAFPSLFGPTIVDIRKLTSDPILIAETGADFTANQPAKIADLFEGIRVYGLLGFVWFDENVEGRSWRINSAAAFTVLRRDAKIFLKPLVTPDPTQQNSTSSSHS